ncbi:uncharacterized protein KZ484_010991 [Pholidichthys leucotaenia]
MVCAECWRTKHRRGSPRGRRETMTSVSTIKSHRLDVPQQNEFNQEEVLDEQQLLNQERNFIVVQVGADCSQIKEEQEDVCISQGGEQFGLKQEPQTFEDAPQLHDCKEEEVLTVQQLCKQESNSSLDQEEQDTAQVQEEEEELCSSREEEHLGLKQETDTSMVTPTDEDNDKSETEPNDAPQLHDCKEEEVLTVQQLCKQESNSSLDQEEQDTAQVQEEEEELCSSREEEHLGLKQETDTSMVTPADEDNDKSETEPNDFPEQHVCKNEFSPDQQLWNQEENLGLEQEELEPPQIEEEQKELEPLLVKEEQNELEPSLVKEEQNELEPPPVKEERNELEPPQVKKEQEELCISQEGEQLILKLEADIFMVTLISEEKQQSDAEPNSEQLLSHHAAGTEIQDKEGSWHVDLRPTKEEEEPKPKKRQLKTGSHREGKHSENKDSL